MTKEKHIEYAIMISSKLAELFDEENESDYHIDLKSLSEGDNLTDFIYALSAVAPFSLFQKLTHDEDTDILGLNQMANRLIFQYGKRDEKTVTND